MNAAYLPYVELSSGAAVRFTLKWQLIGLLLLASHVLLVKQSAALLPVAIIGAAWLYANAPLAGLIVFLQFLIYQNWVISLLADGMEREPTFVILQGTNFAALVAMAMVAWLRISVPLWWRTFGPALIVTMLALLVALVYAAVGALKGGPASALIYFRFTTAMVFAVLVGLDIGRIYGYRTIAIGFLVSATLSIGLGYIEILAPEDYYDAINAVAFMKLKSTEDFHSARDIVAYNTAVLFNITRGESTIDQVRFMGTIMHTVSYAYIICAAALVAWSIRYGKLLLVLIPLLLLSGVKGANLLFACSMVLWCVWSLTRNRTFLVIMGLIMMTGYVAFGLIIGMKNGDYHVTGFLGGLNGVMSNPLGHGIGVGGNLSENAEAGFKWRAFTRTGADFALESAIGVFLYQMGVAATAVFAVFIVLLKMAPFQLPPHGLRIRHRHTVMFIVLATVAVNGIFQEEAYAPTAAGLFTLLCAVIIANGRRPVRQLNSMWQPQQLARTRTVHA